ncbi:MAG: thioredoxin domain-containing protein [Deltaproteobacteria bacterium]|nr:thioredoxin domain-containing protein [Deltaproteobacteria bacterium]
MAENDTRLLEGASPAREPDSEPNRLAGEASAYLLQHAHNPVDWYPWGDEALERARDEDRPLMVSIGYSACHWCHVMERESFEDKDTAALMNRLFVCIKVDREERPDVDQIYMDTVVRLTGQGGWPLTVFCLPDGSPFYGGTYYPDEPRHGMPSFRQVLTSVAEAFDRRRNEVESAAGRIVESLELSIEGEATHAPGTDAIVQGSRLMMKNADWEHGGFGGGPKFPTPTNLEFLLTALDFLDRDEAEAVAQHLSQSANEMARRGLYDHLGGGFHRYCVDREWTIPHFEKMLYDQGLLLRIYAELLRRSPDDADLIWPIRETVSYLRREMTSPEGGFYASQDADSEGVEGAYNVWTPEQIATVLGDRAEDFARAYGITPEGNFEHGTTHLVDAARKPREAFTLERAALLAARELRMPPDTDRKRVAAWNGYAVSGLARAASALADEEMLADAVRAMDFILDEMVDDDGRLHRVFDKGRAKVSGFLDDHAAVLDACMDLHRAGAGHRFLDVALHFAQQIGDRFIDPDTGAIFFTPVDGEHLVHRPQTDHDGATPSAAGLAALGLCRVAQLSGLAPIQSWADGVIASQAGVLERQPHACPSLLRAVALHQRGLSVAVIVGQPDADETRALASRARQLLLPEDAVVEATPGAERPVSIAASWLEGREPIDGRATAFVCHGQRCSLPVTDPAELVPLD